MMKKKQAQKFLTRNKQDAVLPNFASPMESEYLTLLKKKSFATKMPG